MTDNEARPPARAPQALTGDDIFCPGLDPGLFLFAPLQTLPEERPAAPRIEIVSAAGNAQHRLLLRQHMHRHQRQRRFAAGLCFQTQPVVVENLAIRRGLVTIGGRYLLSGAAATRLVTRIHGGGGDAEEDARRLASLRDGLAARRAVNPMEFGAADPGDRALDLILPARNLFNFHHFTKETLPYLTLCAQHGLSGNILIASQKRETAAFVADQIHAFFPELESRIRFVHGEITARRAILPLDTAPLHFTSPGPADACVARQIRPGAFWHPHRLTRQTLNTLQYNSAESTLAALRDRVLVRLDETRGAAGAVPGRRLYVRRRPGRRDRTVVGEDMLASMLDALGFETVAFEDHDVLDQARMVASAEVVVAAHGAGVTNMLYAPPGCLVVELSTLQTAQARFGDFHALALVSGATHLHFVVDHDWPDPEAVPNMATDGHVGQRLDARQVALLRSLLLGHLDPAGHEALLAELSSLARAEDWSRLDAALETAGPRMLHVPEVQIWSANAAAARKDGASALRHLLDAVRLAPGRVHLLDRTLRHAHRRADAQAFAEVAANFFYHAPDKAEALFAAKGWDPAPYRVTEASAAPET